MAGMRNSYRSLVGLPKKRRPLGETNRSWEDIKIKDLNPLKNEFLPNDTQQIKFLNHRKLITSL
jgi:hypothetical protein